MESPSTTTYTVKTITLFNNLRILSLISLTEEVGVTPTKHAGHGDISAAENLLKKI